jgi:hypothetical protein
VDIELDIHSGGAIGEDLPGVMAYIQNPHSRGRERGERWREGRAAA